MALVESNKNKVKEKNLYSIILQIKIRQIIVDLQICLILIIFFISKKD